MARSDRPKGNGDVATASTEPDLGVDDATVTSLGEPVEEGSSAPSLVGQSLQHFDVLAEIGEGGMGQVYRARDRSLDREVAIKVIDPAVAGRESLHARFVREARAQARLQHAGIVQIHYIGDEGGRLFFAMELVDGETLDERLAREGRIEWPAALELVLGAARALGAALRAGVVHRDVKPSNLMVSAEGEVKVADFGLAKTVGSETDVTLTQEGAVLGSPLYISPEQGQGEAADHRSDIYSLGATLHHLLAGKPPFEAKTAAAAIAKHIATPPPKLRSEVPEIPEHVERIVERMMHKDPDARYQDYESLVADLEQARPRSVTRAGFWVRAMSTLVDWILFSVIAALVGHWAWLVFGAYAVLGWWRTGKTVGKWLFRLRVRTQDDGPPSLVRCLGRLVAFGWGPLLIVAVASVQALVIGQTSFQIEGSYDDFGAFWRDHGATVLALVPYVAAYVVIGLSYLVGLAWAGVRRHRQTWHDLVCRTMVVYDMDGNAYSSGSLVGRARSRTQKSTSDHS
ncbi:MAG: protein kinase [Deltaproteobacteria bacterium]|jgi:uncharacterized RDD family membrane protein YckC/predicted Ser/Thr protein kinase|nr:protein kinase [Deltaproteobacteria bacterium]MBW2537719.1 protein kinase [Deltaproteobacteria bacterium]